MNQGPTIQALEYKTIFTLGLTGPQQLNAWPVSMVSLSDFPDAYLAERLSFLGKSQPDVRAMCWVSISVIPATSKRSPTN